MAGETRRRRLRTLLDLAGVGDAPLEPFFHAFEHASSARERGLGALESNERLEFLGDAVLGYSVARYLYEHYPSAPEGELARRKAMLASDEAVAQSARRLGFGDVLALGRGEERNGGAKRASNLGDAFEAFVAALCLQSGVDAARKFLIEEHITKLVDSYEADADAKTALQELTQARFRTAPVYHDAGEEGPPHAKIFTATVAVGETIHGRGTGVSKKAAQQAAASEALQQLRELADDQERT